MTKKALNYYKDHPRIRGEHLMKYGLVMEAAGSSPHTRGARGASGSPSSVLRIIPAYAGSTYTRSIVTVR